MTSHPTRAVSNITAIYKLPIGEGTFACYFNVPRFKTNGVDCDTQEIEAVLMRGLMARLKEEASAFHSAASLDRQASDLTLAGTRVLAFYTNRRSKALIDRFDNPVTL